MAYFHCLIGGGSSGGGYELTVTCDADFAGTTITCTDGVTTLTQTCPSASPYNVVFAIPNGGEWTISGIISGQTYSTAIDILDSLELHSVPQGSTVLPTDDIQTWLACAGITDKSYTTLAEVLADSTTLLALMSNNNAVDYLVRSKTWATNKGLIPVMTSATTPSGVVTASVAIGSGQVWQAFDGDNSTGAQAYWGNQYIQYEFPSAKKFSKFYIRSSQETAYYRWDTLKLQGSNDGSTFTDIADLTNTNHETDFYADVTMSTEYKYFRVLFGAISQYSFISEIQFYPQSYAINGGICEDSTAMTDIGANNYCADTLLSDSTWAEAICNSTYFESVLNVKVPVMTSATTPSGEVSASSVLDGRFPAYQAFDSNISTVWHSSAGVPQWIAYDFAQSVNISFVKLRAHSDVTGPKVSKIQYSNDNNTWTDYGDDASFVDCSNNATWYSKTYSTNIKARYFRLYVSESNYSSSGSYYVTFAELQFYGRADV